MSRRIAAFLLVCSLSLSFFSGCNRNDGQELDPRNPVTVTMWHNYGGQMKETMDVLIEEFNDTLGRERGVVINVTSIAASKEQNEKLTMIAAGDPGSPAMPDLVTAYPSMALTLYEADLLAELDEHFSSQELAAYLPQFLAEGRLPNDKLYVFPIAKSTEALFVNKTLFDRFAAATGVTLESLSSFEGIAEAAAQYHRWTDERTPDQADDGRAFFAADSWFNVAEVGSAQLGEEFVSPKQLNKGTAAFQRIWDFCFVPALSGAYAVADGYSSDYAKTGEIVCALGSTAGILFYGDTVTYADNTSETVEYEILPYPVFEQGRPMALQRGAGMIVAKTTPQKEQAAALFLKWFTAAEQNMRFVSQTGYLPVTIEAFEDKMANEIEAADNPAIKKMLGTAIRMYEQYDFIVAPNYDSLPMLSAEYESDMKAAMRAGRQRVLAGENPQLISDESYAILIAE